MLKPVYEPSEQAPPMLVSLNDNLIAIYTFIRDNYQSKIDEAFDEVSRQIGFVVTTAIPVDIEVGDNLKLKSVTVGADNLKGTLFEKITSAVSTKGALPGKVAAGKYRVYLLWYPALKLKLRTDFMEPAHFTAWKEPAHPGLGILSSLQSEISSRYVGKVPFHGEPVHWFDPGYVIAAEEAVLIHAIDEVYPDLRLAERVTAARQAARVPVRPEIPEPAHYRQLEQALESEKGPSVVAELKAILRKYGF